MNLDTSKNSTTVSRLPTVTIMHMVDNTAIMVVDTVEATEAASVEVMEVVMADVKAMKTKVNYNKIPPNSSFQNK